MKPPRFDYVAPRTVDEAVAALDAPGAMVLAGGQSLLLELAYREHRPQVLVDINGVCDLGGLVSEDGVLSIGALVRHRDLEVGDGSPLRALLARAAPYVAHPPIRSRGTFCGSVAWGHRNAEWNAVCAALDATVHLRSRHGGRDVPIADWFLDDRVTARGPGEFLTSVSLPLPPAGSVVGFAEHRRTHGTFGDVAVAVVIGLSGDDVVYARAGVAGPTSTARRQPAVEDALLASHRSTASDAAQAAVHDPAWPDYLGAVAAELVRRSVTEACTEPHEDPDQHGAAA